MSEVLNEDIFKEVRKRGASNSPIEKENFETLQAIEESIKSKTKDALTPLKYFNTLMTMLNTNTKCYRSLLYLLQLVLPYVPEVNKQNKCSDCIEVLLQIYKANKKAFEPSANRSLIICLCSILKAQKPTEEFWKDKNCKKCFTFLLNQCVHKSPKIRHVAEDEISSLMEIQQLHNIVEPSKQILSYLTSLNKKSDEQSAKDITCFLSLIAKVILFIDASQYDSLFSLLLQIRKHQVNYLEFKSLHPIEIILESSCPLELSNVKACLHEIMAAPVAATAPAVDQVEYVKTIHHASKRLLEGQAKESDNLFCDVVIQSLSFYQSKDSTLLSSLQAFYQSFYQSIRVSLLNDCIVQSITSKYQETLQTLPLSAYSSFIPSVSSFIRLIGESYSIQAKSLIQSLLSLYDRLSSKNTSYRPIIVEAMKDAVLAVPMTTFLEAISLTNKEGLPDEGHLFLFSLLTDSLRHKPCSLASFFDFFQPIVKACQKELSTVKNATQKRHYQLSIANIFSIFGSCCVCATDCCNVLPNYKKFLLRIMKDKECSEGGIAICKAFAVLIRSNEQVIERKEKKKEEEEEEEELLQDTTRDDEKDDEEINEKDPSFLDVLLTSQAPKIAVEQAHKNLDFLASYIDSFIEEGLNLYDHCHGSYGKEVPKYSGVSQSKDISVVLSLRDALTILCHVVPSATLLSYQQRILSQIKSVEENTEVDAIRQHIIAVGELAIILPSLPHSNASSILQCYSLIHDQMDKGSIPVLQRRYYYALLLLCHYHAPILTQEKELLNLIQFLVNNLLTVNVLVRRYRIKSLFYLLQQLSTSEQDHLVCLIQILPQFILCIKDSNRLIRAVDFDIILLLSEYMKNAKGTISLPDGTEEPASLVEYLKMMMGGLASNTAHMKSASLMCISCVIYYHREDSSIWSTVLDLIHMVYSFLDEKSRELVKACFGFIRTCVKVMPEDLLKKEMHDILETLLPWARDSKNHFKVRVRGIIELLVRRLGKNVVLNEVPKEKQGMIEQILNAEPIKTDEQLVKEMEEEMEKIEPNEEDDEEVIELDETGNIVGETEEKSESLEALLAEIASSEDLKRAVQRREYLERLEEEEEEIPSKKQHMEETVEEQEEVVESSDSVIEQEEVEEKKEEKPAPKPEKQKKEKKEGKKKQIKSKEIKSKEKPMKKEKKEVTKKK